MTTFKVRSGIEMWKVKTKQKKEIALRFSDHIKEFHPQSPYSDFVWKKIIRVGQKLLQVLIIKTRWAIKTKLI